MIPSLQQEKGDEKTTQMLSFDFQILSYVTIFKTC